MTERIPTQIIEAANLTKPVRLVPEKLAGRFIYAALDIVFAAYA